MIYLPPAAAESLLLISLQESTDYAFAWIGHAHASLDLQQSVTDGH
jgi:hypothetical protein